MSDTKKNPRGLEAIEAITGGAVVGCIAVGAYLGIGTYQSIKEAPQKGEAAVAFVRCVDGKSEFKLGDSVVVDEQDGSKTFHVTASCVDQKGKKTSISTSPISGADMPFKPIRNDEFSDNTIACGEDEERWDTDGKGKIRKDADGESKVVTLTGDLELICNVPPGARETARFGSPLLFQFPSRDRTFICGGHPGSRCVRKNPSQGK